jgi:hypothetical protein
MAKEAKPVKTKAAMVAIVEGSRLKVSVGGNVVWERKLHRVPDGTTFAVLSPEKFLET